MTTHHRRPAVAPTPRPRVADSPVAAFPRPAPTPDEVYVPLPTAPGPDPAFCSPELAPAPLPTPVLAAPTLVAGVEVDPALPLAEAVDEDLELAALDAGVDLADDTELVLTLDAPRPAPVAVVDPRRDPVPGLAALRDGEAAAFVGLEENGHP